MRLDKAFLWTLIHNLFGRFGITSLFRIFDPHLSFFLYICSVQLRNFRGKFGIFRSRFGSCRGQFGIRGDFWSYRCKFGRFRAQFLSYRSQFGVFQGKFIIRGFQLFLLEINLIILSDHGQAFLSKILTAIYDWFKIKKQQRVALHN